MELPPLIDAQTLSANLGRPGLRVYDATVQLLRPDGGGPYTVLSGRDGHDRAHIPGAAFADVAFDLSDPDSPFPFTVPAAERFAAAAGRLGIGEGVHVVAYSQDVPMWATRLWWLLRHFGFDAVSVLDGGLPAWQAAGGELSAEPASYPPAASSRASATTISRCAPTSRPCWRGAGEACLVNALTPPSFRGEGPVSTPRPGRIPGSVNVPWTELVDPETNRFRSPAEIGQAFARAGADGGAPIISYCGGGISATVDLFALALLGREGARLYDGSLNEWAGDPALPLEVG